MIEQSKKDKTMFTKVMVCCQLLPNGIQSEIHRSQLIARVAATLDLTGDCQGSLDKRKQVSSTATCASVAKKPKPDEVVDLT